MLKKYKQILWLWPCLLCVLPVANAAQGELSGNLSLELRHFTHDPLDARQHGGNASLSFEPEYAIEWDDGRQSLVTTLFARWDEGDDERSHGDIRELMWTLAADQWELRAGIGKVFWGVTESRHLVDIINQSDAVENLDLEDKLGQPMVNFTWIQNWGVLDLFVLPYFRERTFPGVNGRPRSSPYVYTDAPVYQSSNEENHIDYAVRWSQSIDAWDIGVSYFNGTSRDPRLLPGVGPAGEIVLIPYYDQIQQVGLDVQATYDAWLWKLEVINRDSDFYDYVALTGGLEYTFFGVMESSADLGLVVEYLYDDRGTAADTVFQDDLLLALRFTLNDAQSTEVLIGPVIDHHSNSVFYNLEASRRLGDSWKLELEARFYENAPPSDLAYGFRNDDYFQLQLGYYF